MPPPPLPPSPDDAGSDEPLAVAAPADDRPAIPRLPCSGCGASVEYRIGSPELECPFCGARTPVTSGTEPVVEQDFASAIAALEAAAPQEPSKEIHCDACGADISPPANVTAFDCPWCASPVVLQERTANRIPPAGVLPFAIDAKAATSAFTSWVGSLWFAPGDLKRRAAAGKLTGIYAPWWTFDARTTSDYRGQRGVHYYVTESYTVTVNGKSERRTRQVRKTRWYFAAGQVRVSFDDLLVLATRSLPETLATRLEPWPLKQVQPYSEDFLRGFASESYTVGLKEGFSKAQVLMEDPIRAAVRKDIGGDEQRIDWISTRYREVTFKHLLLPVWATAYRYGDRTFQVLVNARTGEVQGDRPYSVAKIVLLVLTIVALIAAVVLTVLWVQRGPPAPIPIESSR